MARTLSALVQTAMMDVGAKANNSKISIKLTAFMNRAYKEVAKREKLEKVVTLSASDYQILKPADYYRVVRIVQNEEQLDFEEQSDYIEVEENGDVDLYYIYIPVDLGVDDEPLTNPGNDEAILHFAKHLYFKSQDEQDKAEAALRDYSDFNVQARRKKLQVSVVR